MQAESHSLVCWIAFILMVHNAYEFLWVATTSSVFSGWLLPESTILCLASDKVGSVFNSSMRERLTWLVGGWRGGPMMTILATLRCLAKSNSCAHPEPALMAGKQDHASHVTRVFGVKRIKVNCTSQFKFYYDVLVQRSSLGSTSAAKIVLRDDVQIGGLP